MDTDGRIGAPTAAHFMFQFFYVILQRSVIQIRIRLVDGARLIGRRQDVVFGGLVFVAATTTLFSGITLSPPAVVGARWTLTPLSHGFTWFCATRALVFGSGRSGGWFRPSSWFSGIGPRPCSGGSTHLVLFVFGTHHGSAVGVGNSFVSLCLGVFGAPHR